MYVAVVLISSAWDVLMFLVPIQGSKIGLSASEIGMVLGAFSAATFVVRVAMPLFIGRVTEWQMIGIVQAVAALVYLVFPLVGSHYGLIALAFVLGLGLGVGQPAVMSLLHRVAPPGRVGEAVGLRMTMINGTAGRAADAVRQPRQPDVDGPDGLADLRAAVLGRGADGGRRRRVGAAPPGRLSARHGRGRDSASDPNQGLRVPVPRTTSTGMLAVVVDQGNGRFGLRDAIDRHARVGGAPGAP